MNRKQKLFASIILLVASINMVGCNDVKNIRPVDGDPRTIGQMSEEVRDNVEEIPNNMGLNAVWSR